MAAPGFNLQIPVGIGHLLFSYPESGYLGTVTFRLYSGQALVRQLGRDEPKVIALLPAVPVLLEEAIHAIGAVTRQLFALRNLVRPILLCGEAFVDEP